LEKSTKIIAPFIFALLIIFLVKCANQMAPTGGDPDLTPPTVLEIYPMAGTTNFTDNYLEITFSEYVDRRSFKESIFISPDIDGPIEYAWSGTSVEISFEDTLKENTTYTITVGTDVADVNNRNKMSEAFNFAFSTGPEIDEGRISGKVYDVKSDGIIIGAYKIDTEEYNPVEVKPTYRSQVGDNGKYKFLGLAPGQYRIIALRDEFRDYLYNIEEDAFGTLFTDVTLTKENLITNNMDFQLTREDTTPPNIISVTMTDQYHLLIEFSEFIDSSKLGIENFNVYDSLSSQSFPIDQLYKGPARERSLFLTLDDSLNEEGDNYLIVNNLIDNYSNKLLYQATGFTVNTLPDTTKPEIMSIKTEYPDNKIDIVKPTFTINFREGIDRAAANSSLSLVDIKGRVLPLLLEFIDDASIKVTSTKSVDSRSEFKLNIAMNKIIDLGGNRGDSVITEKILSINELDFSGVTGKVITSQRAENIKLVLEGTGTQNRKYHADADSINNYSFSRVVPGKYLIWCYNDADSSNNYTFGNVMPFKESEKFAYYPDTLNLRARWPVGDVNINFD
jgi:Big-like domain-containing protein